MYCKHCGKEIDDNSKFCQYCGKSLESNTINYFESIKTFISSNKKTVKIVIGILICIAIGWIWYINTPSYKIVGEWQREIRAGTEIMPGEAGCLRKTNILRCIFLFINNNLRIRCIL